MQKWENTSLCPLDKSPWDIQSAKNRNLTNKLKKKKKSEYSHYLGGQTLMICVTAQPFHP